MKCLIKNSRMYLETGIITSVLSLTLLYSVIARSEATKQSKYRDCHAPLGRSQ